MQEQYHQILYQLIENPLVQIMSYKTYRKLEKTLDKKKFVGTVLIAPSKAFDCIPRDFLIAKLHAHCLSEDTVTFVYSYLKHRKHGVKINDTESDFQILLLVVPQSSVLGPNIFNIFINDLFLFIKDVELANFADDNTTYAAKNSIEELMKVFEKESKSDIEYFEMNDMKLNPDKFQPT